MTQTTGETGRQQGLAEQASAKVQDAASTVQEKTSGLREQGSTRLREQFDQRSTDAGGQARSLADALRRSGDDLRNQGNERAAQLAGPAADRIERLGTYLEQKSGDDLMHDVESFARRRPWLLAGLGMLMGVATARFIKASSEQRYGEFRRTRDDASSRRELVGGRYGDPEGAPTDVPGAARDEPLARDPYAGTR